MRQTRARIVAGIAALMMSTACGSGAANVAPVANAGPAQTVNAGAAVSLNGVASSDADGTVTG